MQNPFPIFSYKGPEYFCDRNRELSRLIDMFDNQRHGLISSARRVGKTGLIHHFHHHLKSRHKVIPVFVDVFATNDDAGFINKLVSGTIQALESVNKDFFNKAFRAFARLKPAVSIDPLTSSPTFSLDIRTDQDKQFTLQTWVNTIQQSKNRFQFAIDEFQQISHYPSSLIDAELRSLAQQLKNVHFLFSGSEEHLILRLFNDSSKPLFASVDHMHLDFLDPKVYSEFIEAHFNKARRKIEPLALNEIMEWTRGHTYYTQFCCNRLFSSSTKKIDLKVVDQMKAEILLQYENGFLRYRQLLSKNQWKLLAHIARQETVPSTTTIDFLTRAKLSPNSSRQATSALKDKGLITQLNEINTTGYQVVDVFLSRWLQTRFDSLIF